MKKFLKWTGIVLLSLIVIAVIALFVFKQKTSNRLSVKYEVPDENIVIPTDTASLLMGQRYASQCTSCHGADFGGTEFFKDDGLGEVNAPNITKGKGGVIGEYTDKDWIRTIRHGVKRDGTPTFIMPSSSFNYFTAEEIGSIVAYLKTVPPVDKQWKTKHALTFLGQVLVGAGAFGKVIHAEVVDHKKTIVDKIKAEVTPNYGSHIVDISGCRDCHGEKFNGFKDPNPQAPFSSNITPGGNIGKWSKEDFMNTLRTGVTPEGKKMNKKFMPWDVIGLMTDADLEALFLYLKEQPKLADAKQ